MTACPPRTRATVGRGQRAVAPLVVTVLGLALAACGSSPAQEEVLAPEPSASTTAAPQAPAPARARPRPEKAPNPLRGVRGYASMIERAAEVEFFPVSAGRSGTGLVLGELGEVSAPLRTPPPGRVSTAVANIPNRTSAAGFAASVRLLVAGRPDVVMLNEVGGRSLDALRALAPGYGAYRDPVPDASLGGSQSMNNVLMWRTDRWNLVDAGRVKVVDDDRGYLGGRSFVWDRYLTWGMLQRRDTGAVLPVVTTHLPTNPARFPAQPGSSSVSRAERYAVGVDRVRQVVDALGAFGPVLLGGDMNSRPGQGLWTAAARIRTEGFGWVKDSGVMYLFHPPGSRVTAHRQVGIASDHPAILTSLVLPYGAV